MKRRQRSRPAVLAVPCTEKDFRENGIIEKNVSFIFLGALAAKNQELTSLCIDFMKTNLNPGNCFQRLRFGIDNKCEELLQAVSRYIRHCLATLSEEEGFLNISHDHLKALVDVDTDDGTEALLTGILRWIKQDPRGRQQFLFGLVKNLKLASVDPASLKRLFGDDEFVRKNKDCRLLYLETIHSQYFTKNDTRRENNGSRTGFSENRVVGVRLPQHSSDSDDSDEDYSITAGINEDSDTSVRSSISTKVNPRKTLKRASKRISDAAERSVINESKKSRKAPVRSPRKAKVDAVVPAQSKSQIKDRTLSSPPANRRKNKTRTDCVTRSTIVTKSAPAPAPLVVEQVPSPCESIATVGPYERNIAYFLRGGGKKRTLVRYNIETRGPAKKVADFTSSNADQVSLVYHSGHIYFLGGRLISSKSKSKSAVKSVCAFNLASSKWAHCPPMREKRYDFQPTVWNGQIYAIAGCDGKEMINCVETFDPVPSGVHPRLWSDADYPDKARAECGAGTVGDKIYLVGGLFPGDLDSSDSDYSDTSVDDVYQELCVTRKVEAYDPLTDTWAQKSSLPVALLGISVAVHETRQCLYVFGGSRKISSDKLKLAFVYYPRENRWTAIHEMCQARRYASSIVLMESIYVIGGNDGKPTMERYDIVSDTWEIVPDSNLPPDGLYKSVAFADQAYGNFDFL